MPRKYEFLVVPLVLFNTNETNIKAALSENGDDTISSICIGKQVVVSAGDRSTLATGHDKYSHCSDGGQLEFSITRNQNDLVVSSAHFSLRNVFYASTCTNDLIVSSRPDLIAAILGLAVSADMVMEQFLMSYLLDDHTLFSDVKRLRIGEQIVFPQNAAPFISTHKSLPYYEKLGSVQQADKWIEDVSTFTAEMFRKGGSIELTGGVDSRLVMALGLHGGAKPPLAFTLGPESSDDARVAKNVCEAVGTPHHHIPFEFDKNDLVVDGYDFASAAGFGNIDATAYSALPGCFRQLAELRDIQVGGLGGECAMGFFYTPFDALVPVTPFRKIWIQKRLFKKGFETCSVFPPDSWQENYGRVYDLANRLFDITPGCWRRKTNGFYLHQRMRQWAGSVLTASLNWYSPVHPLFMPSHINWAASLPEDKRWSRHQQMECIFGLDRTLGTMSYDGGRKYAQDGVERFTQSLNKLNSVIRKTSQKLRYKPTRVIGHGPRTTEVLAADSRVWNSLQNLLSTWKMNVNEDQLNLCLSNPQNHTSELGVLITAAWANDSRERLSKILNHSF